MFGVQTVVVSLWYTSIRARIVVAISFHEVDRAPNAKTGAQRHNKCLKYANGRIEKCHYSTSKYR